MSKQLILIDTELSADQFKSVCPMAAGPIEALQSLENYIAALEGGNQSADVSAKVGAVSAVASFIVSAGGSTAAQAMTLLNVTLTAIASNPGQNQFVPSATAATQATNMVNAINASADLSSKVLATQVGGQVFIMAKIPGAMSNGLQIALGNLANVGTLVAFAGGSDGTAYQLAGK